MYTGFALAIPIGILSGIVSGLLMAPTWPSVVIGGALAAATTVLCQLAGLP